MGRKPGDVAGLGGCGQSGMPSGISESEQLWAMPRGRNGSTFPGRRRAKVAGLRAEV